MSPMELKRIRRIFFKTDTIFKVQIYAKLSVASGFLVRKSRCPSGRVPPLAGTNGPHGHGYYGVCRLPWVRCCRPPYGSPHRPPRIRVLSFLLTSATFTLYVPNSHRASPCFAALPAYKRPVCGSCPSDRTFAAGFFQISPHGGHHCPWLCGSRYLGPPGTCYR